MESPRVKKPLTPLSLKLSLNLSIFIQAIAQKKVTVQKRNEKKWEVEGTENSWVRQTRWPGDFISFKKLK